MIITYKYIYSLSIGTWHGCSAVHTHMTNTRITDPEILEKRYPVILREFSIRKNSGGLGKFHGGDGVIRDLEFTQPLIVSILSERRALAPYGMAGGECGKKGLNILYQYQKQKEKENDIMNEENICHIHNYRKINIGAKNTVSVQPHDRLCIYTPGGGGYGHYDATNDGNSDNDIQHSMNISIPLQKTSGSLFNYQNAQETA